MKRTLPAPHVRAINVAVAAVQGSSHSSSDISLQQHRRVRHARDSMVWKCECGGTRTRTGLDFQVPSPTTGMSNPELSLMAGTPLVCVFDSSAMVRKEQKRCGNDE